MYKICRNFKIIEKVRFTALLFLFCLSTFAHSNNYIFMENETGIPVNKTEWRNGSIVALKTHFYSKEVHSDMIIYSGEPKLISPLMVIVESQPEKNTFDSFTGDSLSKKGDYQCKCIWFSSKTFQMEEARISSRLLQVIEEGSGETPQLKYGNFVELKGVGIELSKRKSSLKLKNNSVENTVTAELSFVSPVMQVIGTVKNEIKEPLRDPNTQNPKRFISRTLVKCKYYNSASDKMTEILIPIDALSLVKEVNKDTLKLMEESIRKGKHITVTNKDTISENEKNLPKQLLLDPKKINFRVGRYYLIAFNYFTAKTDEIEFTDLLEPNIIIDKWWSDELPHFRIVNQIPKITPINLENLEKILASKKPLWITYKDYNDVETKRIISNYELIEAEEDYYGEKEKVVYLKAYCHLRKDDRHFRVDGITSMKELTIN